MIFGRGKEFRKHLEHVLDNFTRRDGKRYYSDKLLQRMGLEEIDHGKIEDFLTTLEEEDGLFEHNVPKEVRSCFAGRSLLAYLTNVYSAEEFVVEKNVSQYVKENDVVELEEPLTLDLFYLSENAKEVIMDNDEASSTVKFSSGVTALVSDNNLILFGRERTLFRREKRYPQTRGSLFNLEKHDLVRYLHTGNNCVTTNFKVPAGKAEVVDVVEYNEGSEVRIRWPEFPEIEKSRMVSADLLKLIRPNEINYTELFYNHFAEEPMKDDMLVGVGNGT